jgi:glyceraldehyde 3-phosphate dehydrogenase
MATRIGISGFGRIGRNFLRAALAQGSAFEIVAVNGLIDARMLANLLKYDSVAGRIGASVAADGDTITLNGTAIRVLQERDPGRLPWADLGVDIAVESTGRFTKAAEARRHLDAGARKVVVSAPVSGDGVATVVLGVNEASYDPPRTTSSRMPRAPPTAWPRWPRCSMTLSGLSVG